MTTREALRLGFIARQRGYVLVRNSCTYNLWSARHGHYALKHVTLEQITRFLEQGQTTLPPSNAIGLRRTIEREPLQTDKQLQIAANIAARKAGV